MAKPFVLIELDRPRKLRLGYNAICLFEQIAKKNCIDLMSTGSFNLSDIRNILYAGLEWEDETLTPDIVGDLIEEYGDLETIANKITESFKTCFSKKKITQVPEKVEA